MCPLNLMRVFECISQVKGSFDFRPIMQALDWELPFEVMCNASDYAGGRVLGQRKGNKPYAIYYASQTLDNAQMNMPQLRKNFWLLCSP